MQKYLFPDGRIVHKEAALRRICGRERPEGGTPSMCLVSAERCRERSLATHVWKKATKIWKRSGRGEHVCEWM
jgi:hypothetical protein